MDPRIILLIGLAYVAQSQAGGQMYSNEPVLSPDGKQITCGTKFKPNLGVLYNVSYRHPVKTGGTSDEDPSEMENSFGEVEHSPKKSHQKRRKTMEDSPITPKTSEGSSSKDKDKDEEVTESTISDLPKTTVYEYCLEEKTESVMYAKYKLDKSNIASPVRILDRNESTVSAVYDRQFSDIKSSQISQTDQYYEDQTGYDSESVGIYAFVKSNLAKAAFYKFDVSAPLNKELRRPWQKVIQELQLKISKFPQTLMVYSGVYETYRYHGVSWYMKMAQRKVKIPFAWWIQLQNEDETQGVSVIMQNYAFNPGEKTKKLCEKSVCSDVGFQFPQYSRVLVYCCRSSVINAEYAFADQNLDDLLYFNEKSEG